MANKSLFRSRPSLPGATAVNEAGGIAYAMSDKEALAQLAVTGTFHNTHYVSGEAQMDALTALLPKVDPAWVAEVAIYAAKKGGMKDMPSYLLTWLSGQVSALAQQKALADRTGDKVRARELHWRTQELAHLVKLVFAAVVTNGKMLRNYVQMVRSGVGGRTSLGSAPRSLVGGWFASRTPTEIFLQSVGDKPSLGDVLSLAHPAPPTMEHSAIFAYLKGKETCTFNKVSFMVKNALPPGVLAYEAFKDACTAGTHGMEMPTAPFEMLMGLPLTDEQWKGLAMQMSWTQLRMNVATLARHKVFESAEVTQHVATKLGDADQVRRAKAMPYQLLMAYLTTKENPAVPVRVTNALQDAADVAVDNVPVIQGLVAVLPDISGSMHSPITGQQVNPHTGKVETHTSKAAYIDVAALVAASVLRKNPEAWILPFETKTLTHVRLNPRDSLLSNATILRRLPCGGTNCSAPLVTLNSSDFRARGTPDLVWYVSDNESWVDNPRYGNFSHGGSTPTRTMEEWAILRRRNPKAVLVCMDIAPCITTQVPSREGVLNVGGWNDSVFDVVRRFVEKPSSTWVGEISAYNKGLREPTPLQAP